MQLAHGDEVRPLGYIIRGPEEAARGNFFSWLYCGGL